VSYAKETHYYLSAVIIVLLIAGVFAYTQWQKTEQKLAAIQADSQDAQLASESPAQDGQTPGTQPPPYGQPGVAQHPANVAQAPAFVMCCTAWAGAAS